ncbi:MAG: DUF4407 domain-containing protein [Flavipsychrobacter sp.]
MSKSKYATEREYYKTPRSTKIMRLFWKAAGADRYILERSTYGDQIKYLCLGGIIIATGVMAGIAGGYAFYTIFEPKGNAINSFKTVSDIAGDYDSIHIGTMILSMVFGTIWGLIIFNIDRFIITSTGKGDGTEEITKQEIRGALPRLLMGAIIALTISKPVEIRMFKTEIDIALHEKQIEQQQIYISQTDSIFNAEIRKKDVEIVKFEEQLLDKRERYAGLEEQYIEEARIVTVGPRAKAIKSQMDAIKREISSIENNSEYMRIKAEKRELEVERKEKLKVSEKVAAGLDGLLERIKLAHEKAGWMISLFITLLFMAIELTPIFFKLMLIKSPYDYMEENIKELIKAEEGIEIKSDYYQDREGRQRDLVIHHQVIKLLKEKIKLLESQSEISDKAINEWKDKKLKDVSQNPDDYINEA